VLHTDGISSILLGATKLLTWLLRFAPKRFLPKRIKTRETISLIYIDTNKVEKPKEKAIADTE
jgi:hypothetical protein